MVPNSAEKTIALCVALPSPTLLLKVVTNPSADVAAPRWLCMKLSVSIVVSWVVSRSTLAKPCAPCMTVVWSTGKQPTTLTTSTCRLTDSTPLTLLGLTLLNLPLLVYTIMKCTRMHHLISYLIFYTRRLILMS